MKALLRNREPRFAWLVGALVALLTALAFALGIILDFGGGSFSKGWNPGLGYLSFYGVFLIPLVVIAGFVTTCLCRLLGNGLIALLAFTTLGASVVHDVITSKPGAQLSRVTERKDIPNLFFEKFGKFPSFSDGTVYIWTARCSDHEAEKLVAALGMESIPSKLPTGSIRLQIGHPAVRTYENYFEGSTDGVKFYLDRRGMVAGYSHAEQRFRLLWWPAALADDQTD